MNVVNRGRGWTAIDDLEWSETRAGMNRGIVRPLREVQITIPLTGFVMNVSSEILFQGPINDLSLSVELRVIGGGHAQLCATETEEFLPEMAEEKSVAVGDEASWKAVVFANHVNESSSHLVRGVSGWKSSEMGSLGIAIYHDQNYSMAVGFWKTGDKID